MDVDLEPCSEGSVIQYAYDGIPSFYCLLIVALEPLTLPLPFFSRHHLKPGRPNKTGSCPLIIPATDHCDILSPAKLLLISCFLQHSAQSPV
jgi:hypothetical protein